MHTSANFAATADLEDKAVKCDGEARRLEEVAAELNDRCGQIFSEWTGTAATSLEASIQQHLSSLRVAESHLRQAAAAFRRGVPEVVKGILQAEVVEIKRSRQTE